MKTTDLFKFNRTARRLNESLHKTFGKKLNLENFDLPQLEDARNKLRTQLSQVKAESGFNETLENEAYQQAQFMLDAINAEITERQEFIVDSQYNESINRGNDMKRRLHESSRSRQLYEGEIQQASAIVTAKTMVDRVGRWIEELSGMENDTLLQLGDSIRDEMSQQLAKQFISTVAPAIQQALQNLKQTRETLATGVRTLTGEEQGAEMLGASPTGAGIPPAGGEMGGMPPPMGGEMGGEAGGMPPPMGDEFAAAEPAAGGIEAAGREQRESINFQNRLLKVLAG